MTRRRRGGDRRRRRRLERRAGAGRARRSVIVIDAGSPRNAPADGVHGFLTRDGISPAELIATGRQEVERVRRPGRPRPRPGPRAARRTASTVTLDDGRVVTARRLLVTTGPGRRAARRARRARALGPRRRALPVLPRLGGPRPAGRHPRHAARWAVHQALLFRQWTSDLVLFTHTAPALTDEQAEQLAARGIRVVRGSWSPSRWSTTASPGCACATARWWPAQAVVVGPALRGPLAGCWPPSGSDRRPPSARRRRARRAPTPPA